VFVPKTPETFTYDADGNLLSDGRWNYTWDAENRLVGTPLRRSFNDHTVNSHGGILYDPSYGTNYTSKLAWEDASVEFFANPLTPDTKGVLQTRFEPDFP
jgi:YD repeat-containing protein